MVKLKTDSLDFFDSFSNLNLTDLGEKMNVKPQKWSFTGYCKQ